MDSPPTTAQLAELYAEARRLAAAAPKGHKLKFTDALFLLHVRDTHGIPVDGQTIDVIRHRHRHAQDADHRHGMAPPPNSQHSW